MALEDKISQLAPSFGKPTENRFGIPALNANDGPNGWAQGPFPGPAQPRALGVTAFPNEIALAATWDRQRADDFGTALAEEWRGKGSSEIIAPTLNIMRTWHWGRSAETFGEDPFLNGQMASVEVAALQRGHVIAMVKHFAGNNQDWERVGHFPDFTGINEIIPERALHEIYYPGFKEAIETGGAAGVMCAYNQINGTFSCNNAKVLGELHKWGFSGAITPDAVFALHDPLLAAKAGVTYIGSGQTLHDMLGKGQLTEADVDRMLYAALFPIFKLGIYDSPAPGNSAASVTTSEHVALARAIVEEGSVLLKNEKQVLPITASKVKSIAVIGVAAGPQAVFGEEGPTVHVEKLSIPAEAIAQRAGSSMKVSYHEVGIGIRPLPLLKGEVLTPTEGSGHGFTATYYRSSDLSGTPVVTRLDAEIDVNGLPAAELGPEVRSFGPPKLSWSARWSATLTPSVSGEYGFSLDGAGSSRLIVDGKLIAQLQKVNFKSTSFGLIHLKEGTSVSIVVEHSNDDSVLGSFLHVGFDHPHEDKWNAALEAARSADVAVVFAGEQLGEGMDKTSLNLPGNQNELIDAVAAVNSRTVVVLNTSTPVAMPWINKVASVLESWYPGQESGEGIASVLFGDADPGGRLPITFPASPDQGPATKSQNYPGLDGVARYDEGIFVGYRWYDQHQQQPLFPFGHGLSYTTFEYSNLHVSREGNKVSLSVAVTNTGARKGSEVVQVYVTEPDHASEPPLQLKGFEKLSLSPGERKTVNIEVPLNRLSVWSDEEHGWKLWSGTYKFAVGTSSRKLLLESSLQLAP
ncbi:glycoside hydrolase family 3 C-terminal domain-containing protein [Occallatibacter savannae]|uniref:glycoside hydrolase family 3 C-terminal domain-containing protein n=1 Tax=Occallatibacter savannae TaxID=1002691 RepID=UPI0013A5B0D3|nr:glycoside hydrolase family 3 C-terminal domain-containing protein [Occallatibacter savannae]